MQNKQKILYIITNPDWGGAQKYVNDMALINANRGFDVIVSAGQSAGFSKINLLEEEYTKSKKHQFKNLIRQISPIKDLKALLDIKSYIDIEKPDYVHLNSSKAGILGSFASKLSKHKPKVWYTVHGWVFNEPMPVWKKYFYIFLERLASKYRDKIIVLGEREKQIALKYKICTVEKLQIRKQKLLYTTLSPKNKAIKELNLPQNKKIIGTIANLYPAKGLNYLIDAAAQINNPDIIFAVIGEGPERMNYESRIMNYGLKDKFILLGERKDASQYLSAFDAFVMPSVKEGAPYAILEAMYAKLPIIATDVGSISEMLKNYQQKTIIPPHSPEEIKNAIKRII